MDPQNVLYYGDNLEVLRRYIKDETIDLVYLDPPFNSNATYNVLFAEKNGSQAAAQIQAFEDTWHWDQTAAASFQEVVEAGGKTSQVMQAFRTFLGDNDILAYLAMMAPRLVELRRVLKPTGSIYLHCDTTASHYLKVLMDAVFHPENFLNEIVWKRTFAHGSARRCGPVHDLLLFYAKTDDYVWTGLRLPQDDQYVTKHFRLIEETTGRAFQPIALTGAGVRYGESGQPWRGVNPTKVGRHWALPGGVLSKLGIFEGSVQQKLDALDAGGRIYWPAKKDGSPRLKWYADELGGTALLDVWTDIPPISAQAAERLGYPTQKPEALLERIIQASSHQGDTVLDPFCGCGTTISAAQKLKRRWIGIDITHLAINLIKHRLQNAFGRRISYQVIGEPVSLPDAAELAKQDPYQFQWWTLGLVGARSVEGKKGADKGIDGRLYFHDDPKGKTKQIILSVKAGETVTVAHVRDLRGVLDREKAEIGVLLCMAEPTKAMRTEAASAGFYISPWDSKKYPRLQILTIADLLNGKAISYPAHSANVTFGKAAKAEEKTEEAARLL